MRSRVGGGVAVEVEFGITSKAIDTCEPLQIPFRGRFCAEVPRGLTMTSGPVPPAVRETRDISHPIGDSCLSEWFADTVNYSDRPWLPDIGSVESAPCPRLGTARSIKSSLATVAVGSVDIKRAKAWGVDRNDRITSETTKNYAPSGSSFSSFFLRRKHVDGASRFVVAGAARAVRRFDEVPRLGYSSLGFCVADLHRNKCVLPRPTRGSAATQKRTLH